MCNHVIFAVNQVIVDCVEQIRKLIFLLLEHLRELLVNFPLDRRNSLVFLDEALENK
jgi:hypothetical protein